MAMQNYLSASNLIVLISFLDLFGVSMLITCLSSHVKSFDVSTTSMGIFFSLYGGLQLLSSYVMGHLSDRYGQLRMMIVCSLLSSVGYVTMGMAPSFGWLCLSRCITGGFKHTQSIGRALLASSANQNAHKLGYFSSLGSAGFIIGPIIGGWIYDHHSFQLLAWINAALFLLICLICVYLLLSADPPHSNKGGKQSEKSDSSWRMMMPSMWDLFVIQFIMGFSVIIFRTNYSYTLRQRFHASGTTTGLITSYGAVVGTISSLLAVHVSTWYGQSQWSLLLHLSIAQCCSMLLCATTPYLGFYVLLQTSISFVNAISRECLLYLWFTRTSRANIGKVIGVSGSLMAFARLISPFLGGLCQEYLISGPMYAAFLSSGLACLIISRGSSFRSRGSRSEPQGDGNLKLD